MDEDLSQLVDEHWGACGHRQYPYHTHYYRVCLQHSRDATHRRQLDESP